MTRTPRRPERRRARALPLALAAAALCALASRAAAEDPPAEPPPPWKVEWKDGLRIESPDKNALFRVGGRIHYDWAFFSADDELREEFGPVEDGTEFRRARLMAQGLFYGEVEFKAEYDFAGATVAKKDVFIGLRHVPLLGTVRAGHFKEPFSLEELVNDNYITFLERSLVSAFVPSRNSGLAFFRPLGSAERATLSAGAFRDADDTGNQSGNGEHAFTGRITGLPLWKDEGRSYLHLGAAASLRSPNDDMAVYRQRPEANLAPRLVDTGTLAADDVTLLGGEAAFVSGAGSLQAECAQTMVSRPIGGDAAFLAYSIQAAWTLTGEERAYNTKEGVIGQIRPTRNHSFKDGGAGAFELAARFSQIDLNDQDVEGGMLTDWTAGLNWYLNPVTRIMLNAVLADREDTGTLTSYMTRFQIEF